MHDSKLNHGVSVGLVPAVRESEGNGDGEKKERRSHGGARPGAGRPRSKTTRVPHTRRPEMGGEIPANLTLRIDHITDWGGNLRDLVTMEVILRCFEVAKDRFGMRICHYSVQSNHIHLLVEADDRECLIRGMRGLTTRLARNLNKHWGRKGKLFTDRYHSKPIEDAEHGENTIAYLGRNDLKHNSAYTITPSIPAPPPWPTAAGPRATCASTSWTPASRSPWTPQSCPPEPRCSRTPGSSASSTSPPASKASPPAATPPKPAASSAGPDPRVRTPTRRPRTERVPQSSHSPRPTRTPRPSRTPCPPRPCPAAHRRLRPLTHQLRW